MLQRVIYGVLHYGKDVLLMIGGGETLCYVALLGTAIAFLCLLLIAVLKKSPVVSADIAYVLNKNVLLERIFRLIAKGCFMLSLVGVGVDAFTPPSPFLRPEILIGYCVLYALFFGLLHGILLWVIHAVNGKLTFGYRLSRLAEERRLKARLQAENAQVLAVQKENGDLPETALFTKAKPLQGEEKQNMEHKPQAEAQLKIPLLHVAPQAEPVENAYATCGIASEGVLELLNRAKNLPFSEADSLRYKRIELAVRDALSMQNPPKETVSSLLAALLKLYAKYDEAAG